MTSNNWPLGVTLLQQPVTFMDQFIFAALETVQELQF